MLGILKSIKYARKLAKLQKLIEQAKQMGLAPEEENLDTMLDRIEEMMNAKLQIGPVEVPKKRKRKTEDDEDEVKPRRRTIDIDAYMMQQMDMIMSMFDKMFTLYERMDRKMQEVAKRVQKRAMEYAVKQGKEEEEESWEDKLIEKIVERWLLGDLTSKQETGQNIDIGEMLKNALASDEVKREKLVKELEEEVREVEE